MGAALSMKDLSLQTADAVARGAAPGIQMALVERGAVVAEHACGVPERSTLASLTSSHLFQAASLAKCVTAWTVLRLAAEAKVDLDAPVERYVTRWRLPQSPFDPSRVTVRRVLSHTAGLSLADYPGFEPARALPPLEASLAGDTNGGGDLRVVAEPGARFGYSGGGFVLLQLMVEELTGERFADHAARAIFAPLGMPRSTFDPSSPLLAAAATGHDADGRALPFYRFDGAAAAGLFTTAGDLARLAAAHLAGPGGEPPGRGVVPPASIAAMTTPLAATGRDDGLWGEYGLGFEIDRRADGRTIVGHHGMNRGWRALLAIEPNRSRALVLLANSDRALPALEAVVSTWRA